MATEIVRDTSDLPLQIDGSHVETVAVIIPLAKGIRYEEMRRVPPPETTHASILLTHVPPLVPPHGETYDATTIRVVDCGYLAWRI